MVNPFFQLNGDAMQLSMIFLALNFNTTLPVWAGTTVNMGCIHHTIVTDFLKQPSASFVCFVIKGRSVGEVSYIVNTIHNLMYFSLHIKHLITCV